MLRLVGSALCASIGFRLSRAHVVRRVTVEDSDIFEGAEEDQVENAVRRVRMDDSDVTEGVHCVVWGDWSFEGKKFRSQEEAEEFFKQKKRTELATIHIHGLDEVDKFMSKRLTDVNWAKMKKWCGEVHEDAALVEEAPPKSKKSMVRVREDASLVQMEEAPPKSKKSKVRMRHNGVVNHKHKHSLAVSPSGAATSLDAKASTLSGKVATLEKGLTSLASKASSLLESIGVDSTIINGSSIFQLDPAARLKSRLAGLDAYTVAVQEKTNVLETEFFGSTTTDSASFDKSASHSFKAHVEAVAAQADDLKRRLSVLENTPLLGEATKLEDETGRLGSKAGYIFTSIGMQGVTAPAAQPVRSKALKARLGSLEEYVAEMQRNAAKLEYEILGNSWTDPSSSDSQKERSIKDHASTLGEKLRDLDSRLSALASAPIVGDVEKMETAVVSLGSRAASLSKNIGLTDNVPKGLNLASQGVALNKRIISLDEYVGNLQTITAALEEELAGAVGTAPAQAQKNTMSSKVKFLELQLENTNSRISALEQQL